MIRWYCLLGKRGNLQIQGEVPFHFHFSILPLSLQSVFDFLKRNQASVNAENTRTPPTTDNPMESAIDFVILLSMDSSGGSHL